MCHNNIIMFIFSNKKYINNELPNKEYSFNASINAYVINE